MHYFLISFSQWIHHHLNIFKLSLSIYVGLYYLMLIPMRGIALTENGTDDYINKYCSIFLNLSLSFKKREDLSHQQDHACAAAVRGSSAIDTSYRRHAVYFLLFSLIPVDGGLNNASRLNSSMKIMLCYDHTTSRYSYSTQIDKSKNK